MTLYFIALATYLSLGVYCVAKEIPLLLSDIDHKEATHFDWLWVVPVSLIFGPVFLLFHFIAKLWRGEDGENNS